MPVGEHQARILPLFKNLTSLSPEALPEDQWDPRLVGLVYLPRGTLFSCFHPSHLDEAEALYRVLYEAKDFNDFIALAENAKQVVNEGMFAFSLSVAILNREDCKGVILPPIQEVFPDRFVPAETINRALKVDAISNPDKDTVIPIKKTGNIRDPEYNVAYFREDVGINNHHWHWHLVYPSNFDSGFFGKVKDRKGELFYYMHQQMCARYDCERLSNGLNRMIPFHNFEEPLDGYAAHLTHVASGRHYASRPDGMVMHDIREADVQDMQRWRERILKAIDLRRVTTPDGRYIPLDEEHGADILGSLIESSYSSLNRGYYGSLHNWGHVMMANIHDPDGRFRETPGVMTDTATSLRDPIFYRYHRFIDNIFQEYKGTLPVYTKEHLDFPQVTVTEVKVKAKIPNVVHTFFREDELELSHCLHFAKPGSVKARYHHLDHESFSYIINVQNNSNADKLATVRIFLAPKYDELGNPIPLEEQRRLYIEMDKFRTTLRAGKNTIVRASTDSSVTLSTIHTFKELLHGEDIIEGQTEFCSCGWPQHLLVPKGSDKGMTFDLFVMLTDGTADRVEHDGATLCSDALSYCGVLDQKYPDKRAMGFPFDRKITAEHREDFLTGNMSMSDVVIRFQT